MVIDFEKEEATKREQTEPLEPEVLDPEVTAESTDKETDTRTEDKTPEISVVPEVTDYENAVDPNTGKTSEENVPHDPNVEQNSGNNPNQQNPQNQQQNTQQPQGQQQPIAQPTAPVLDAPKVSASEFKGKAKSFFGLDTEKGFWETLDKKVQEALQGRTPEEVAENMAFAMMTLFFDMIGNWADNNRKERKRIKKEYEEKVKAHDHDMGVKLHQKLLLLYAVMADHPEMRKHTGKPLTKEVRKDVANILKNDKKIQDIFFDAHDALCHRDTRGQRDERNGLLKNLLNAVTGNADVDTLKGMALNDPMIMEAIEMSSARNVVQGLHQQVAGHQAAVNQNNQNRNILNQAQHQQQPQQQQQQRPQQQQQTI